MPPKKTQAKKPKSSSSSVPPQPFKRAPEALRPFTATLSPKHVYITHVDRKPIDFKRKIFAVPVALNLGIVALFVWRTLYVAPWYFALLTSALGYDNETTVAAAEATWGFIAWTVARRAFTFLLDFVLVVFVWPWPLEFVYSGRGQGSPVQWRWNVGFREKEVYVRRSRPTWDGNVAAAVKGDDFSAKSHLMTNIGMATSPTLLNEKTGYLTMNNEWDLDWSAMVRATKLVDDKTIPLDAFRVVVLVHHEQCGWLTLEVDAGEDKQDDARRLQVFAFRDALAAVGKEDLFYRWIEIVQFESSQPDGFGPEKQVEVAKKIRDLFEEQGIDFDRFWKDSVGSDGLADMS
ncbi:hypothetical protein VPNG_02073 [Cytospora leucostoma]|uniref:Uncharacterized protein n=1 Tax=Cytospora leucostoma TaxID=1230097 RepID=A0A423XHV6_9PEZI|nr:hypothetical protein VPNG_02073 [Cytospora leucostoma]